MRDYNQHIFSINMLIRSHLCGRPFFLSLDIGIIENNNVKVREKDIGKTSSKSEKGGLY